MRSTYNANFRRHRRMLTQEQLQADDHIARQRITPEQHADRVTLAQRGLIQASAHLAAAARLLDEHATNRGDALLIQSIGAQIVTISTRLRVAEEPARKRAAWE